MIIYIKIKGYKAMLGIDKDIDSLVHLLLATLAQGELLYNSQKEEFKAFYGEDRFNQAEELIKGTRIYNILLNS